MKTTLVLLAFAAVCFIQNMAFTWSSRSRNSGDPNYHRWASFSSNGVYWLCNLPMTLFIVEWRHNPWMLGISGIIYTLATAEGSVLMMRILLKRESGKRQVGAR